MAFDGPSRIETQSKRHLSQPSEYSSWEYLRGGVHARSVSERARGVSSSAEWMGDPAGDGSKFHAGFFRGRGADWGKVREARDRAAEAAFVAHDGAHRAAIGAAASKSGFNPITGVEMEPAKDGFLPRGRVCVQ